MIRDPAGEFVYANRAGHVYLGIETLEQLGGRSTAAMMSDYWIEDERGVPLQLGDVPSTRARSGEPGPPLLMRAIHRETGELRWHLVTTTALHDRHGSLLGTMTEIEDMTAVKTAEIRTRLLAESGRLLASTLDYQETLRTVARLAVPLLADFCSVDLVDEQQALERVAFAHDLGSARTPADELENVAPASLPPDHPVRRVLETGVPLFHPDANDEQLAAAARDEEHRRLLLSLGLRSVLVVPMQVPNRTIGLMTLATTRSGRRIHDEDVELAEQLARRAAVAVENSRLHTKVAGVAETLQKALLPAEVPAVAGWEIEALYWPTETELRIDVGGDFYEVFDHDGRWFVILGDVAGKGVTAASVTALLRHGARVACRTEPSPAAILARLDESLTQQQGDEMATALCMCLHDDHVVISSAGHPPAIVVGTDGKLREAPSADPLLGAFLDAERGEEEVPIGAGELLVLYTDGVIDAPGLSERFGPERLRRLLSGQAGCSPSATLDRLGAELAAFSARIGGDDIAVIVMRLAADGD